MRLLRLALPTALALSCAAAPASAAPVPVTGGALTWTQANVYESGAPAGTNRTWLGYTTITGPPFTNGSMTASDGATGATVDGRSARGATATYDVVFPTGQGGTYDAATGSGTIELRGTLTFRSQAHRFTITIKDPQVVLAGARGQLFASGSGSSGGGEGSTDGAAYDRSRPVLDLDLSKASTSTAADGTRTISGIVPAVATANMVWPGGNYPQGAGPDRTPNTFGSLSLELRTGAAATVARPRVSCKRTRTKAGRKRTTCDVRVASGVRKVVVRHGKKRLKTVTVRKGRAKVVLPRKRRTLTFVAADAKGRELSRRQVKVQA